MTERFHRWAGSARWAHTTRRWLNRWGLWVALSGLLVLTLGVLVWLAGRYEISQVQNRLERDVGDAVVEIRAGLLRTQQSVLALDAYPPGSQQWPLEAMVLLRSTRDLMRLEARRPDFSVAAAVDSPYRMSMFRYKSRPALQSELALACANGRRLGGGAYSASYFQPMPEGLGQELMELCIPLTDAGVLRGYLVAVFSLHDVLTERVGDVLKRGRELSFTEPDGTRLAMLGPGRRGTRMFSAQQLLNLPGYTLVVRMDTWRQAPDLFPNVLTALVTAMAIALVSVLVLLVQDVRRRVQAERGLAESLAFRKAMEDSLVTGLRARDMQGRTTYVNPAFCAMTGFSLDELIGQSAPAPYWPPERVGEYQKRQAVRWSGQLPREGFESEFVRKDGSRFQVLIIEAPLINASREQTGWMSAFLDITDQRAAEERSRTSLDRLQATARLATVGEMASLLSHELNQPLAAIASYASGSLNLLADEETPLAHDLKLALARMAQQAERAGKVIRSVHDFVRRREQARESVTAHALLEAIWPLVSLQARKLGIALQQDLSSTLPPAHCDRTMVEQVLLNLSRNAMQAMDSPVSPGKTLTIRVHEVKSLAGRQAEQVYQGRWLEFAVVDAGPGISDSVAKQLFTPFFTTKSEGMGLGLSLCRTVIEQHGGYLEFEPGPQGGTVFRFTLPAL